METNRQQPRVTVRDIAHRLKTSHTTVSRALRDDPRISVSMRLAVKAAAQSMGYSPDPMLAALAQYRSGKSKKPIAAELAWINCWPDSKKLRTFKEFDLYWQGAYSEAESAGYRLEDFNCPGEISPARLAGILRARNIRGLLLTPGWAGTTPEWENFPWNEFSIVRFGHSLSEPKANVVTSDQLMEGMLGFENIWNCGYRRVGMVMYECQGTRLVRFSAGYLYAQLKIPPKFRITPFGFGEGFAAQEHERFAQWLKENKPDAILTDVIQVKDLLPKLGYNVPNDIGLAALSVLDGGVDAGINQNSQEIGAAAVQLLISSINHNQTGIPAIPREVLVAGSWVNGPTLPIRQNAVAEKIATLR